jgi:DNA segregation ATPase FtsK/SpoIIIE-like protein
LMGRGDFVAVAEGRVTRFQAAHVSPQEIHEVVAHLAGGQPASGPATARASLPGPVGRLADVLRGDG